LLFIPACDGAKFCICYPPITSLRSIKIPIIFVLP
jgi:hypothetical protein